MKKFELFYPVKPKFFNQYFANKADVYTKLGLEGHNGIDFQAVHGQPVYAAHDGVCFPEIDSSGGNGVVIRTNEPFEYQGQEVYFKTIYWHLMKANAVVHQGQRVKAGDLIGYADNTGTSTGDHLHFGLKPQAHNETDWVWYNVEQNNGYLGAIDPMPYFNLYFAEDAQKVFSILLQTVDVLKKMLSIKQK